MSDGRPLPAGQAGRGLGRKLEPYRPRHRVRLVTATALFDGHDASINILRRLLQASGAEVVHLGTTAR
jgi:methylmalonyl-CoA mutase